MSYPQGSFYPQSNIYPQGNFYPSGGFGHPQAAVGHPQGIFGQGTFGGYPQQPFGFGQGATQQPFGFAQGAASCCGWGGKKGTGMNGVKIRGF